VRQNYNQLPLPPHCHCGGRGFSFELNRRRVSDWFRSADCVKYAVAWKTDGSNVGGHPGDKK
jgi:hypothetical protein